MVKRIPATAKQRRTPPSDGFTIVESLVAGVILFILMLSTNRFLLIGMANSTRSGQRTALELEILNDIEEVQAIDALINNSPELKTEACTSRNPALHLSQQISTQNPVPSGSTWGRQFDSSDSDILIVTYEFAIPMRDTKEKEYRIVELNPSFMATC